MREPSPKGKALVALCVIPEGFEPPIFWAVTRGIIQLCYGTKFCPFLKDDAKIYVFDDRSKNNFRFFFFGHRICCYPIVHIYPIL